MVMLSSDRVTASNSRSAVVLTRPRERGFHVPDPGFELTGPGLRVDAGAQANLVAGHFGGVLDAVSRAGDALFGGQSERAPAGAAVKVRVDGMCPGR